MKKISIALLSILILSCSSFGQANLLNVKSKKFKTSRDLKVDGQVGFLEVPENRNNPSSRKIKLKYVHLKSISKNPSTPVIYLEGGGGVGTIEAYNPKFLDDRMEYLEVADFIFIDRNSEIRIQKINKDEIINHLVVFFMVSIKRYRIKTKSR